MNDKKVLLEVRDLSVKYKTRLGLVSAVDHVSFDIHEGEILGLVGESGCGKSTMGKALMRMIQPPVKSPAENWSSTVKISCNTIKNKCRISVVARSV